ncbi:MAG: hypothetical protein DMD99_04145 [Candidatus Rokuibacteriota bacterium]|nr:MAG: hypothetical protein DMD99_04145 [Candidatus Rokubacteria bacterium]
MLRPARHGARGRHADERAVLEHGARLLQRPARRADRGDAVGRPEGIPGGSRRRLPPGAVWPQVGPEVVMLLGVFTLADLPELREALPPPVVPGVAVKPYRQSALADGLVRFAGEAVAVVVAGDPYRAADGAAAVGVEYERSGRKSFTTPAARSSPAP